jgi:glycosyltransferase involved in cell wall biosynthesis
MRVVMISKALVVGAYRQKAVAMAAEPDIDLTVVVPPYWREGDDRLVLEETATPDYRLIVTPMARNGSYHTHYYPLIGGILADVHPDLVHIDEEPYNLATWLALRAARRVCAHTVFFSWQNLHRRYPPPFRWLEDYVYKHAGGGIAGNHAATQVLGAKGYTGPLAVIPQFGVDPDLYAAPLRGERPDRPFTIGFAGRLVEEKGLMVLVDALAQLGDDWRMQFYGDGPLGPALKARFDTLGLAERISWQARIPSSEMPDVYAGLDAVVLPSLTRPNWMEQFGRVLIEAMACETPVVGSDSGEIPHVIGDAGLVVPEGDATALAHALTRLRDDPLLQDDLRRRGRQRVLANYTQAQVARETVAFYRQVCAR